MATDIHALARDLWWSTDPINDRIWSTLTGEAWAASGFVKSQRSSKPTLKPLIHP